jgi:uncharacterized repeat protein (TIGR01451 family)
MKQRLFGVGAVVTFVAAVAVVLSPVQPAFVERYGRALSGTIVILMLAVALAGLGLRYGSRTVDRLDSESALEQPPEEATAHGGRVAGGDIDDRYDKLLDGDVDSSNHYGYERDVLRSDIRAAAVAAVADAEDISKPVARKRIENGDWTDDVRAQSFLGSPERPVGMRFRDWASGRGLEQQVEATMAEIERIAAVPQPHPARDDDPESTDRNEPVRGGGIEGGNLSLTDQSRGVETTVTTADTETSTDRHWEVGTVVAVLLVALGFVLSNAILVLSAIVPAGFAVYGSLTRPPEVNVDVERVVADESPVPGEPVRVGLTVTNVGDRPIAELRVIDGVPPSLRVVSGSPRLCVSLGPEESATVTYTVEALRGTHTFEPVSLWVRNVSGEVERSASTTVETTITCRDTVETMPTTDQATPYQGRIDTDASGAGLEFYATREYQTNDPLNRIDWNYWAQTGDPRTVEFRQSRAGTIVVILDDRSISKQARDDVTPDAVTLGRHAALRVATALLDDTNAVGGALLTHREYERPGRGREQERRLREFFFQSTRTSNSEEEESSSYSLEDIEGSFFSSRRFDWVQSDRQSSDRLRGGSASVYARDGGGIRTKWLRDRLPGRAQVVFVSPLLDDAPLRFLRTLQADGTDVTVLSPNVTTTDSPGGTAARIERHERLRKLRRRQCRVIDWAVDTPLSVALERAEHGWSR